MAEPATNSIVEILGRHFEELVALCERRLAVADDPEYLIADVEDLDRRIEAHVDGLVVAGEASYPLLEEGLGGGEAPVVFAAAYALLRMRTETAASLVMETLLAAEGEAIEPLAGALCRGPIDMVERPLREALASAPAPVAVAVAEVLAFHGRLSDRPDQIGELLRCDDPRVRRAAWRVVTLIG